MRYYKIIISDDSGEIRPSSLGGLSLTSLLPTGQTNTSALNVELDLPLASYHTPDQANGYVRIWGLGLADIGAAFNLNPQLGLAASTSKQIEIYGGMAAGLPLANPAQARLLVKGSILQAYGNWIGVEQTVDLIIAPTSQKPLNLVLNWTAGTTLAATLQNTLSTALPKATLEIQLSPRLVQDHDEPAIYSTLEQLASVLNPLSKKIITDANYPGVNIAYDGATIRVQDLSTQKPATKIAFTDLIGQPTWISPGVIQAKLVMRGDLDILDTVTLPPSLVGNSAAAMSGLSGNPANMTTFSGNYTIKAIHHYGNFRQPDGSSWVTVVNLIVQPKPLSTGAGVSGGL